jgi:hypothetical protein
MPQPGPLSMQRPHSNKRTPEGNFRQVFPTEINTMTKTSLANQNDTNPISVPFKHTNYNGTIAQQMEYGGKLFLGRLKFVANFMFKDYNTFNLTSNLLPSNSASFPQPVRNQGGKHLLESFTHTFQTLLKATSFPGMNWSLNHGQPRAPTRR